jgi:hypothetical protein
VGLYNGNQGRGDGYVVASEGERCKTSWGRIRLERAGVKVVHGRNYLASWSLVWRSGLERRGVRLSPVLEEVPPPEGGFGAGVTEARLGKEAPWR